MDTLFRENGEVRKELLYEYRVVHVDIGHSDKNLDLVKRFGATLEQGVPFITVVSGQGKVVTQQETGALETGDHHDPAKVMAFLAKNRAAPQDAAEVFAAACARAKSADKRVLLSFEAPW